MSWNTEDVVRDHDEVVVVEEESDQLGTLVQHPSIKMIQLVVSQR